MIAPELMGHVPIPFNWKEFVFHRGCSFNLETGLIKGGKGTKEGRHTIFFTLFNAFGENSDEEEHSDDISLDQEKCTMRVIGNIFRTPSIG